MDVSHLASSPLHLPRFGWATKSPRSPSASPCSTKWGKKSSHLLTGVQINQDQECECFVFMQVSGHCLHQLFLCLLLSYFPLGSPAAASACKLPACAQLQCESLQLSLACTAPARWSYTPTTLLPWSLSPHFGRMNNPRGFWHSQSPSCSVVPSAQMSFLQSGRRNLKWTTCMNWILFASLSPNSLLLPPNHRVLYQFLQRHYGLQSTLETRPRASCICFIAFLHLLAWCIVYSHTAIFPLWT